MAKPLALELARRQAATGRRRSLAKQRQEGLRVRAEGQAAAVQAFLNDLNDGPNRVLPDHPITAPKPYTEIETWVSVTGSFKRARQVIEAHNRRGRTSGAFEATTDNTGGL